MTTIQNSLLALGLIFTGFTTSASADTYDHIDGLANHIARQSRCLTNEVRRYRHTPEYRHLVDDANDLYRCADHLHEVAHNHGSIAHMESDVRTLDSKLHHLISVFRRVERNASRGYGYVQGSTSRVWDLIHSIEDDIDHLRDDLRELRRSPSCNFGNSSYRISVPNVAPPRVPVPNPYQSFRPTYPFNHGYSRHQSPFGGRSISIGGGSSRLTFSF